ncbi:MAG: histidinol dehydrogenase [Raineya sp.]|nr:histidinol dehydrogenase [Raineya sp.]
MLTIVQNPTRKQWESLLQRPTTRFSDIQTNVETILEAVRENGDKAVRKFNQKFDNYSGELLVSDVEIQQAIKNTDKKLRKAIEQAYENIYKFHAKQLEKPKKIQTTKGITCWRKSIGIEKVGLYIPGGTAPLFSTVLMLGIPAQIAGCNEVILCTPAKNGVIHPAILFSAWKVGVHKVFKVGGVQAIGAMAFGTESVPKVYKIFGPGNQFVTLAKQKVASEGVAIDMPAGPSEVMVWADETARAAFVAADLLSQAEHGTDSQVILVTNSYKFAENVKKEVEKQLLTLPRNEIAEKALAQSKIIVAEKFTDALDLVNFYAPEHLILALKNAEKVAEKIINAGSVFLGNYAPESAGDYASGTNHTLPTNGFAKAYSGVSVDSFVRKITFQKITKKGLQNLAETINTMAEHEQLEAHKRAVTIRL